MSTTTGKISQLPSIITVNGSEFIELVKRDIDGSLKNYKVLLRDLRSELGLSAYDNAVKNGFVGSEKEWLASLKGEDAFALAVKEGFEGDIEEWLVSLQGEDGKSAYALAVEEGFEGDIEEWLESLKGKAGLSAFETAVAGGYTGTEAEFNTNLSNASEGGGGSGVSGAVFITDVQPEDVNENTGNKVKSEDSFSLVSCESTTNDVKVHVTAVTGNTNYRPNVTVNGTAVRLIAGEIPLLWKGIVSITLPAGGQSVINAKHEDGAESQATVTMSSAPVVTSAFFEAVYPDGQTEFKAGDKVSVTFTADVNVIGYEIKDEGALVASSGNVTAGNTHTVTNLSVADRGDTAQMLPFSIRVKEASGAWSEWYKSDIEGDTDAVNVINLNNLKPVVTIGAVEYPEGQTALKEGDTAIVSNTVSNFTTVAYSSVGGQLTITDPTVSEAAKTVTCSTRAYNDSTNNLTITATRAENGTTTIVSTVVKVASEAPTLAITLPATRLRSGGNLGTSVQNHVITITSNQALVEAPSLTVPSGTLIGTWTPNPARTVWKRSIAIHDDDAKGVFSFGDISAVGPAGIEATTVTTGATYTIGGFVVRRMSVDAYPVRSAAMEVIVTDVTKLRCSNLSKGGVGSNNFTYQATQAEAVDRYTIINDNEWYNCDGGNATSNTSGVMKVDIEELA